MVWGARSSSRGVNGGREQKKPNQTMKLRFSRVLRIALLYSTIVLGVVGFVPQTNINYASTLTPTSPRPRHSAFTMFDAITEVAGGENDSPGAITSTFRGCSMTAISPTEYSVQIDGDEADLGRFSEQIYKKLMIDAKQQRFQGFRPGTVPPHLLATYKRFAMDETAREVRVIEERSDN